MESLHSPNDPRNAIVAQVERGLEAIWLLAVVVVPLAAAPQSLMLDHVAVPQTTALQILAALMVTVWSIKWLVKPSWPSLRWIRARAFARDDPGRWLWMALGLFALSYVVATFASASPAISIWGKTPGTDGYGLYQMAALGVLLSIIATHLRTPSQMRRLVVAFIATGTVVGLIAVLQRVGLEPFLTGGATVSRPPSTLGNPIFAGAVLVMTTIVTLGTLARVQQNRNGVWSSVLLSAALVAQLSGIIFTLSRGPWIGLAFGTFVFIGLTWYATGFHVLRRITIFGIVGLLIAVTIVAVAVVGGQSDRQVDSRETVTGTAFSIVPQIAGGGISGRTKIWNSSLELITDRPWHDVAPLTFGWARHFIGYGPELYRYVYPLVSPPKAGARFPFQAHNVPLHVAVETGLFGVIGLIGIAIAVGWVGLILVRRDSGLDAAQRLVIVTLLAVLVGRGVEMMAGIPKVADLTLLAAILGALIAAARQTSHVEDSIEDQTRSGTESSNDDRVWLVGRAILVLVLVVSVGALTWLRAGNYAVADVTARQAIDQFEAGESQDAIRKMLSASDLAPGVVDYHLEVAGMFETLLGPNRSTDANLRFASGVHFFSTAAMDSNSLDPGARASVANGAIILGVQGDDNRIEEAIGLSSEVLRMMPNFAVSHHALALGYLLNGEVSLGLEQLDLGEAILDQDPNPVIAGEGAYLRGVGLRLQGDEPAAIGAFSRSLELDPNGRFASNAHGQLAELYDALGDPAKAEEHRQAAR